jgi:DNA-binding response OmpR family regulator
MSTITSSSLEEQKTVRKKAGRNKTGSILVVDDEFDVNTLIKMSLQKRGYDVFGFTDPLLALEHFHINKSNYSLVISDIRMPEFVGKARIINLEVKILLMTAFEIDDQEFAGVTSKLKIDGYIQKPISMGKLNGIIDMHMMPK